MSAQRQVWGETISLLAADDPRILVLDGDLATSTKADIIAVEHPDQFLMVGIAEQNMIGMAAGLTTLGYRPWISTFGVFMTQRSLDQIRMLVSQTNSPVRFAASYTGLLNGSSGKTHQDIADIAIMRAMPNMTVIAPADGHETAAAMRWAAEHDGPVYLRLARDDAGEVFDDEHRFKLGSPQRVRSGENGVTVISTGVQTSRTQQALEALANEGTSLTLIHLATLKPLDERALLEEIGSAHTVITVEEHTILGGMGGLVAEIIASSPSTAMLHRIGLADMWAESAPNDFLLDKYGLSSERVAEQIRAILH